MNGYVVTIEFPGSGDPVQVKEFDSEIDVLDYCKNLCLERRSDVRFSCNGLNSVVFQYVS